MLQIHLIHLKKIKKKKAQKCWRCFTFFVSLLVLLVILRSDCNVVNALWQFCGSEMIYSGSGSSFESSEFRIQAKVPDPCGYISDIFGIAKKLKFNQKEQSTNYQYQLFSILYFSPTLQKVHSSQA